MLDVVEIQNIIPHRFPFLLLDRVIEIKSGESIHAYKNVSVSEHIFQGHFPGHPIYPGVMIVEGLAQAGGVLAFKSMSEEDQKDTANKVVYFMSIDKCKFRAPVVPGDKLEYKISVIKHRGNIWVLKGEAFVDGKLVTEAELKAMIVDK
jgi:3-hydroxyacyl-[acyl-carrier-protein] dehydratase